MAAAALDVITIGRSSVDLYGIQVGGRLEDMASFAKYVGGSPANIAIGAARLGLRAAIITAVGDEHMGRHITQTLSRAGVDVSQVKVDPQRLSALVLLGIRDRETFPLIFYRENCADMGLGAADVDPAFIGSAKAIVVTGTHFSTAAVAAMSMAAIAAAKEAGRKVAFDIDYRPNLWELGGHGDGASRFASSAKVTAHLQKILPHCDLVVGTEEEWHIAGGATDTLVALRRARELTAAVLVAKRGELGCTVFADAVADFASGITTPVPAVEVFNVLGAGDGFMAGFLSGWLADEPYERCARRANTCGALAVSRHGCAPAYPSRVELERMLDVGSEHFALREDAKLEQLHWSTTAVNRRERLFAFAFDHRSQFFAWSEEAGREPAAIGRFKQLALDAALLVAADCDGCGILVDDQLGREALHRSAGTGLWVGRPIEKAGSFPLEFVHGPDLGSALAAWPQNQAVKVLAPLRADDDAKLIRLHEQRLCHLAAACRNTGHEFLLEIITERPQRPAAADQVAGLMERLYELGVYPDWWKLEPFADEGFWRECGDVARRYDPHLQGIIVLGKEVAPAELVATFAAAATEPKVAGFAVGRNIFAAAARAWLAGEIDDDAAVAKMAGNYRELIAAWPAPPGAAARTDS